MGAVLWDDALCEVGRGCVEDAIVNEEVQAGDHDDGTLLTVQLYLWHCKVGKASILVAIAVKQDGAKETGANPDELHGDVRYIAAGVSCDVYSNVPVEVGDTKKLGVSVWITDGLKDGQVKFLLGHRQHLIATHYAMSGWPLRLVGGRIFSRNGTT